MHRTCRAPTRLVTGKLCRMTMTFEAVLFDCDGVLVDSEPITMAVLRDMLALAGWDMPLAECMAEFVGVTVRSKAALIEARTGRPLTDAWMAEFYDRRNAALQADLKAIAGADVAVQAAHSATGGRIACASALTASRWKCSWRRSAWRGGLGARCSAATSCRAPSPRPTCTCGRGGAPGRFARALPGGRRHAHGHSGWRGGRGDGVGLRATGR